MALELYKFEKSGYYPHMNIRDKEIWERFIDKFPDMYLECQYDYHVGDAPNFNTFWDDDTDRNQDKLYRLRIDAVAHTPNRTDIIEVKPQAGPSTIGQVESYKELYVRDGHADKDVKMCIVTDIEKPNMRYLCEQKGIKLFIV